MKKLLIVLAALVAASTVAQIPPVTRLSAQSQPPAANANVPMIPFDSVPNSLKYSADMNLGEVLGVAVNSKGRIAGAEPSGQRDVGPAVRQRLDAAARVRRRPASSCARSARASTASATRHGVRYDKYDNLWVVDKGTHTVDAVQSGRIRHAEPRTPARRARRARDWYRGNGSARRARAPAPAHVDGNFRAPTDIAFDSDDNIYISDGYIELARGEVRQARQLGQVVGHARDAAARTRTRTRASSTRRTTSASIARTTSTSPTATTGASRCSTATATFMRFILLNAPVRQEAASGARQPRTRTRPTRRSRGRSASPTGPTQYLYTSDSEPGRIYKLTLDGKIVGMLGESGHELGQFNWIHGHRVPVGERAVSSPT